MCDLEEPEIWREAEVVARKAHTCDDCDQPIAKRESYLSCDALYRDGGWSHFKVHVECMAWRDAHLRWDRLYWNGSGCGAEMGQLIPALEEAQREIEASLRSPPRSHPNPLRFMEGVY